MALMSNDLIPNTFFTEPTATHLRRSMVVVLTLHRRRREPRHIGAVIIHHMISPHPQQLVALMKIQLRQGRLVPPVPLLAAAAAPLHVVGRRHRVGALAAIDFEPPVRRDEGRVRPVGLHSASLRGPIVGVPD